MKFEHRASLFLLAGVGLAGCHRGPVATAITAVTPAHDTGAHKTHEKVVPLSTAELKTAKPNEAGLVPILEYHNIKAGKQSTFRTPEKFRQDLKRLYDEGYRPISLSDYLNNRIALPYGQSPVILTFDDALPSQFTYLPDGSIDPNCAVGILQTFHKEHPDFAVRATFYVLPTAPGFGPKDQTAKKLQALLAMGCEIGNHTLSHPKLNRLSDKEVQEEIAGCAAEIKKLVPGATVDTLALPMGIAPRNKSLSVQGNFKGTRYHNRAVMLVGAEPARAPIAKRFNPMKIPRIQALEGPSGSTFWLDRLKAKSSGRYISDGDPEITTVPKNLEAKIDPKKLNGAQLRTY